MGYRMTGSAGYNPDTVFLNVAKVFITTLNKPHHPKLLAGNNCNVYYNSHCNSQAFQTSVHSANVGIKLPIKMA